MTKTIAYQQLNAGNDAYGNPRRVWLEYGEDGQILAAHDEGYSGRPKGIGGAELPPMRCTTREYRSLLKAYGA